MKYYKLWAGIACAGLIISSFLPWTYYSDLNKVFTGFFSERNMYGKPGKVFIFFAVIYFILVFIKKPLAKQINLGVAALNLAYLIKTYVSYTGCYLNTCPQKLYGLYILIAASLLMLATALLPDLPLSLKGDDKETTSTT